jgi:polyisoprenoid-binding protein YceI
MSDTKTTVTPGVYRLDPVHSTVGFSVMHKVSRFRAGFADVDATLTVDGDGQMTLSGVAHVSSVQVKNAEQAAHLQSPEFFDATRFPAITFDSTSVAVSDDGELTVVGELALRGHSETVEATGTITYVPDDLHDQERVGIDLMAVVDRTVFGLRWNQALPGGGVAVEDDVTITVELELPKAPDAGA